MPVRLIPCRLKDDHTVTRDIGETALFYFPEWQPIPDDPEDAARDGEPAASEPPADEAPKTGKAARTSAKTSKEQ